MTGDHTLDRPVEGNPEVAVPVTSIDHDRCRYPYCIVWSPIPVFTWLIPFLGHMGICTSIGVIHDFGGPFFVSEDMMTFGNPTKYWQLTPQKALNGQSGWDTAIGIASETYRKRMHILCYDNCHSHVAMALNLMNYDGRNNWNMITLALYMLLFARYVSFVGFLKTWLPLPTIIAIVTAFVAIGLKF